MKNTEESNDAIGIIILILFCIGVVIQKWAVSYYEKIKLDFISAQISMQFLVTQWKFWLAIFISLLPLIIFINYKINHWIIQRKLNKLVSEEKRKRLEKLRKEEMEEIEKILSVPMLGLNSNELDKIKTQLKNKLENSWDWDVRAQISSHMKEISNRITIINKREELEYYRNRLEESKLKLEENERKNREYEETSLKKLNASNTPVFIEEDLTEKDKTLLLKHRYKRTCEYCLVEQKLIKVLVKPTLRHSVTHTFLVWSAVKMISKIKGTSNVFDWDTREADITFKHHDKSFAVEIETGTLLSKKVQLRNKIDYLNSKFKDRWMIIVSKKNLLPKYRKFGPIASRSQAPKKLKNMLKNA